MAPLSHDVPWPRTYTPYLSCAASNQKTTTLTVSELGQPRQQLPLAYPRGLSRSLAAAALTPTKGTFTSLKLPYCKYRLLWLPTTRTTLESRTYQLSTHGNEQTFQNSIERNLVPRGLSICPDSRLRKDIILFLLRFLLLSFVSISLRFREWQLRARNPV